MKRMTLATTTETLDNSWDDGVMHADQLDGVGVLSPGIREVINKSISHSSTNLIYKINTVLKRSMDIGGSIFFMILLSPIYVATAVAIMIEDGYPIFYNQYRVAKKGKLFKMYKFRSMYRNADERKKELESDSMTGGVIFKMKDDPRITRTGKIIRKLSIDELPQLWNVLKGDLALVGPRPPIPDEVAEYSSWEWKRLDVKPGLTCTWQVSGRSDIDFDTQVKMDIEYIRSWNILKDLQLLLRTVPAVLSGKGAY